MSQLASAFICTRLLLTTQKQLVFEYLLFLTTSLSCITSIDLTKRSIDVVHEYMKKILTVILALVLVAFLRTPVSASSPEAGAAGTLSTFVQKEDDSRIIKLRAFLRQYNSPFESEAATFVHTADLYNLDWKFVVCIAGLESTFGKHIPVGSYNAWGWGIPTGASSGIAFSSWEKGIVTVSRGLRMEYINKGFVGVEDIGRRYAASPTWAVRVRYFMEKLDAFHPADKDFLAISL